MTKKQKIEKKEGTTIQKTIADLRAEIVSLSLAHAKKQLKHTTSLRTKKDELARVLTVMNMQKKVEEMAKMKEKEATK